MKTWLAYLALAAGGGLLIGALLVLGVDVVRLSREGPRWRRRMMGAGLVLLAALGLLPMAGGCAAHKGQTAVPVPAELKDDTLGRMHFRLNFLAQELAAERVRPEAALTAMEALAKDFAIVDEEVTPWRSAGLDLDEVAKCRTQAEQLGHEVRRRIAAEVTEDVAATPEWAWITGTWHKAEEIATLQRGEYPYGNWEKDRLLKELHRAGPVIHGLYLRGLLSEAEAGLLSEDAAALEKGVNEIRTREESGYSCYMGGPLNELESADGDAIERRVGLLQKMAESGRLRPEVVERVIAITERQIAALPLERPRETPRPEGAETPPWQERVDPLPPLRDVLGRTAGAPVPLAEDKAWQRVAAQFEHAQHFLERKGVKYAETVPVQAGLYDTSHLFMHPWLRGAITETEYMLLHIEGGRLSDEIRNLPAVDVAISSRDLEWRASGVLARADERLPLLAKLAGDAAQHAPAVQWIVRGAQADAALLRDPRVVGALKSEEDRQRAPRVAAELAARLAEIH